MRTTILFGGTNKERLVSVASAQALCEALPDADLWFWDADDSVHQTHAKTLLEHARPFELAFRPGGTTIALTIERPRPGPVSDTRSAGTICGIWSCRD